VKNGRNEKNVMEENINNIYQKIDKQTELLEQIAQSVKKTQRYILVGRILSIIRLIIIAAPIILAIIYLPPYIKKAVDKVKEVIPQLEELKGLKIPQETSEK